MSPDSFLSISLGIWVCALGAIVGHRMLTGRIRLGGLLSSDDGTPSVARLQTLLVTLSVVATFVTRSITTHQMATIDGIWVGLLGGSHLLYLGAKAHGSLFAKS